TRFSRDWSSDVCSSDLIVYSPQSLPVNFTLTHWKNDIRDRIGSVALQYMVDNEEDFPGRITRDADGNIVLVDARPVNINFVNTEIGRAACRARVWSTGL